MLRLILALSILMIISPDAFSEEKGAVNLKVEMRVLTPNAAVEGPVAIEISISNVGDKEIYLSQIDTAIEELAFQLPEGWVLRKRAPFILGGVSGIPPPALEKGQSISRILYLHDYFATITPGKTDLTISLKVPGMPETAAFSRTVKVDIGPSNHSAFETRIKTISEQIKQEKDPEKRAELYRSLANMENPDLIPLFTQCLKDDQFSGFYAKATERLVALCEKYGDREPIIKYLIASGGRYDNGIFNGWKEMKIKLPSEQLKRLSNAPNPWIRFYSMKTFANQFTPEELDGSLKSLQNETSDLGNAIEEFRKQIPPPK